MKLYELKDELTRINTMLEEWAEEHEGDYTDFPLNDELDNLELSWDEKVLGMAVWIKNLKSDSEAIANEMKTLTRRKTTIDNHVDSLKGYMSAMLPAGTKIENAQAKISWRKSSSVVVSCEIINLPEKYQRVKVEADKTAIKDDIKAGIDIPGVAIVNNVSMQIK